jgi:hypothetical protein
MTTVRNLALVASLRSGSHDGPPAEAPALAPEGVALLTHDGQQAAA